MLIKQITAEEAVKLFLKGKEVKCLIPDGVDQNDWKNYIPDTLANMLEGVMFFRQIPAIENDVLPTKEEILATAVPVLDPEVQQMMEAAEPVGTKKTQGRR